MFAREDVKTVWRDTISQPGFMRYKVQQFPLMACEAYTTYVGGVSMGNVTPHLSL